MTKQPRIILGIDPGYADTGWGVIAVDHNFNYLACGSITTSKALPLEQRLNQLDLELQALIKRYQPEVIAVEQLFFNTNTTTALKVAQARGVILLTAARHNLRLMELTPTQIKLALTSDGHAAKQQVGKMVMALLHLPKLPKPDDAVDALACAIAANSLAKRH